MKPFKSLSIYRTEPGWLPDHELLFAGQFKPCQPLQAESMGWSPTFDGTLLAHLGEHAILTWEIETKIIPPSTVKRMVSEMADAIQVETGEYPDARKRKELKEQVMDTLLPVALSTRTTIGVWIDTVAGTLAIDTTSTKRADEIISSLIGDDVISLNGWEPTGHMRSWLYSGDAPEGFTLGNDCRLVSEEKEAVTYKNRSIEGADVQAQLDDGMTPDQLGMQFSGRVNFTLRAKGQLSKIEIEDYVIESAYVEDGSDVTDIYLMTGEFRPLIAAVEAALTE